MDAALDCLTKAKIEAARGVRFHGFSFVSDESPPSSPSWRGLRLQITWMYIPYIPPVETWEASDDAPISVDKLLMDILHCLGKDGTTVAKVLDKQFARVGVTREDAVSGTTIGGGARGATRGHREVRGSE